jgi:hypothetical protein
MTGRRRLLHRRVALARDIEHAGHRYRMHVGHFPDGALGEVFLDATKQNSMLDAFAADAAILRIILPDLIPEGMTILAGKPKVGKSWFALDVCLAAADENRFDSKPADNGLDIPNFLPRRPVGSGGIP